MFFPGGKALGRLGVSILFIVAITLGCLYQRERCRVKNAGVVQEISQLAWRELPPGADSHEVLDFLTRHDIPHSEYMVFDSRDPRRTLYGAPAVVECRMGASPVFPFKTTLYLLFRFDQDGKLQSFNHRLEGRFF